MSNVKAGNKKRILISLYLLIRALPLYIYIYIVQKMCQGNCSTDHYERKLSIYFYYCPFKMLIQIENRFYIRLILYYHEMLKKKKTF